MAGTFKGWNIVETPLFCHQRDGIEPDVKRMDAILEGVYWGLGQNPREGFPVSGRKLWVIKTNPFPSAPRLRIWYTIHDDTETVELLSIELIEND